MIVLTKKICNIYTSLGRCVSRSFKRINRVWNREMMVGYKFMYKLFLLRLITLLKRFYFSHYTKLDWEIEGILHDYNRNVND